MDATFSRDVILTLFTRLLAGGSLAVAEIFVSSVLKVEGRGAFALFLTSQALIDALVSMGLPAAIIKTIGQKQYTPSQMATWALFWGLGQGWIGALLFHSIAIVLQPVFFKDWNPSLVYWMYLCLPSFLVAHYLSCIFLALQHSHIFNLIFLSQRLLFCLFAGGLYFYGAGSLHRVTGYYSLSAFGSLLAACVFVSVYFRFSLRLQGAIAGCLELYRFGSTVQVGNIFEKFALRSDIYIVNYFAPAQLGYYAVARSAADILAYFPISISLMLFPRVSQNPEAAPPASTARICRLYITLQMFSFLLLFYPIYWVILRWLPEFETSIPLFLLLIPGCIGYGVFQILSLDSMGRDQNWLYARYSALFFLLVVLCDLTLLPLWQVYGGAFGTGLAGIILGVAFIATYSIRHGLSGRSFLFLHWGDLHSIWQRLRQEQGKEEEMR